eukprot:TRINITY_DN2645_c0_g1_i2.p1 TRINITY_DN2645_c0_g1~~TRINITY_DN2645_c0_g1_i2.p1  ORF type:complete len:345 (+),score=52.32 TRINITY_DN2645_c0_g1_i2:268-1302(+)
MAFICLRVSFKTAAIISIMVLFLVSIYSSWTLFHRKSAKELKAAAAAAEAALMRQTAASSILESGVLDPKADGQTEWAPPSLSRNSLKGTYSAICLMAKDENLDIREWMVYHQRLGVGRVYVWDNNSSVPLINEIQDFVDSGFAVYQNIVHECDKKSGCVQQLVYQKCLDLYTADHVWMGFIDTDEFVVIPSGKKLDRVLQRYESYGGLVLHWRWFASSGHISRPAGGVLPNYHTCCPEANPHVKTFAFMDRAAASAGNPHNFIYKDGFFAVNNEFQRVDGPLHSPAVLGAIYLNHYNVKSQEDYIRKIKRGRADAEANNIRTIEFFNALDATCRGECPALIVP